MSVTVRGARPARPARARVAIGCAVAAVLCGPPSGSARAEPPEPELAEETTLQLDGGAAFAAGSPVLALGVTHFLGEHLALGLRQEGGFDERRGRDGDRWHLATMPFVQLHLLADPKPRLSPFVGVAAGALYDDRSASVAVGPEAGVALFLTDAVYLQARYQFRWAAEPVGGLGDEQHLAWLGIGVLLDLDFTSAADLARAEESAARAEEAATRAEEAVARLEAAVDRLERAVDAFDRWFKEQLRK